MKLKRYLAAALACLITATAFADLTPEVSYAAGNLISNSTFDSGTSGWGTYKESGGACSLSTSDGKLALNISSVGSLNYSVQVYYDIIPLYQNATYRLKYDISCSMDRFVEGMIQQNGGTYQAYTWKGLDISPTPQTVDYTFTMEEETDIMAKLVFNCGTQGTDLPAHTIYLDNVSLELVDDSNVSYEGILPYEAPIVTNQIGYRPDAKKIATFRKITNETQFSVVNAQTGAVAYTGELYGRTDNSSAGEVNYLGDFSAVTEPGDYYITCGGLDQSYTFTIGDGVYDNLLDDSVRMMYLQRCGVAIHDPECTHAACHNTTATIYGTNQTIDVSGGWHDAGDYGRYVVPAAKTAADMLYAYQANPELYGDNTNIPESGNGVPDILDEVRWGLSWMFKMQSASGGVHHKVTCASFPGYIMPEEERDPLIVSPVSTTATADFCAVMAMGYEFYYDIDRTFAEQCLDAAKRAWSYLESNPNFILVDPTNDIVTGSYGDKSDRDERYWATAQMYRATGDQTYMNKLASMSVSYGMDWSTVGDYGNIALLTMDGIDKSSSVYTAAQNMIISQANTFASRTESSPYGVALTKFEWGSNMTVANAGVVLGLAYDMTGDAKYINAANENLNYLLGKNPNSTCYVTGYGTVSPLNPHHRPSMAQGRAMKGMLVGGVNSNLEDSAAKAYLASVPSAKCYVDHAESYSTNEVTTYWNSPLIYLISLTEENESGNIGEEEKLQGDVNLDGAVTVADAVTLARYLVREETMTAEQGAQADMDNNGTVNAFDLAALKRQMINR